MEFTINADVLSRVLGLYNKTLGKVTSFPVLENLLIEAKQNSIVAIGTDMELTLTQELNADVKLQGSLLVPRKLLFDLLKINNDSTAHFRLNDINNVLTLTLNSGVYTISCMDLVEFPKLTDKEHDKEMLIPFSKLKEYIKHTISFRGNDDLRPAMTGIYMHIVEDDMFMCCTNAHVLGLASTPNYAITNTTEGVTIPYKLASLLLNLSPSSDIKLMYNSQYIEFHISTLKVSARLIDSKYPNVFGILRKNSPIIVKVNKEELIKGISSAGLLAESVQNQVQFNIENNQLILSSQDLDFNREAIIKLPCETNTEKFTIAFNINYLLLILNNIESPEIILNFDKSTSALQLTDGDYLYLQMPLKIS